MILDKCQIKYLLVFFCCMGTFFFFLVGKTQRFSCPEAALLFGQHQESQSLVRYNFLSMRREFMCYSQPIRFVRLDSEHAQSDRKSMNHGISQRSQFLVLTKRSTGSGDKNKTQHVLKDHYPHPSPTPNWGNDKQSVLHLNSQDWSCLLGHFNVPSYQPY